MPFVETTMIAGYGPEVKKRLVTGLTRAVRSVMAAPLEGVIVCLREVEPANWARGGVSRIPGPPLPAAAEVVSGHAAGEAGPDGAPLVAPGVEVGFTPVAYTGLEEAFTDDGTLVYAQGALADGTAVLDRYHVRAGQIVALSRWTASVPVA